jgi:hypothetical protein
MLNTLFYIIIAIVAILWVRSVFAKRQDINIAKSYCEEKDITFINCVVYEKHIRLHYKKDGISGWANFKINEQGEIKWLKETPEEKIKLRK